MGYACPVCETPQADGRHLANHIAFTAMIHGDDHEAWLAEHAPGWEEAGERELAGRVVECASEIEFPPGPATGEHRGGRAHGHGDHEHGDGRNGRTEGRPETGSSSVTFDGEHTDVGSDPEGEDNRDVAAVVAEARELTRRMRDGAGSAENSDERSSERSGRPDRGGGRIEEGGEDEDRSDGRSE